jgi:lipopolysaccharide/colanic/teichoic acid biosynthesis glycosyltransferase
MYRFSGIVLIDQKRIGQRINGVQIVADRSSMVSYLKTHWVDEVFFDIPYRTDMPSELVDQVIKMGITVHTKVSRIVDADTRIKDVEQIGDYVVLTTSLGSASPWAAFAKRCLDIAGSLVGCMITLVLIVLVGPLIYIASPGPIFFKQKRVGCNGRVFEMYKFRSMYMDAEERKKELMAQNEIKDGLMFKMEYDPRIIGCYKDSNGRIHKGIGNLIRDLSIDEFPQFFNVLKILLLNLIQLFLLQVFMIMVHSIV